MRPVNPFHIYPVYNRDLELSLQGYYYAPTYRTQSLQFKITTGPTITDYSLVTSTGSVLAQDAADINSFAASTGETFFWTTGASLDNPPANGTLYRPRITLSNGLIYWGHQILADAVFDIFPPTLANTSCTTELGVSTLTFAVTSPANSTVSVAISDDNGSYTATGGDAFSITTEFLTASSGSFSLTIAITQTLYSTGGGYKQFTRSYTATMTEADPCGTIALAITADEESVNTEQFEITTDNTTDIISQGKLFSQGYTEKLWIKGYFGQPEPVITENYLANGESEETFQSARVSERKRIDFWPLPDAMYTGLVNAKYHDTTIINSGANVYTLYRLGVEPIAIENEDRPGGRLLAEFEGAFIQSIMADYESA